MVFIFLDVSLALLYSLITFIYCDEISNQNRIPNLFSTIFLLDSYNMTIGEALKSTKKEVSSLSSYAANYLAILQYSEYEQVVV